MKYLLDTNTCIRYLNGRSPSIFQRLDEIPETSICVCSVVKFEMRYGALRSQNVETTLARQEKFFSRYPSLPFDDLSQLYAAQIRADLARVGTPIGPYDRPRDHISEIDPENQYILTIRGHGFRVDNSG
jgi:tRNA(fMet)-specific endonuclease VapC